MVHGSVVEVLLDVEEEVLLVGADGPHQLGDVVGVQGAGLGGQTAGQVGEADVGHSLKISHTETCLEKMDGEDPSSLHPRWRRWIEKCVMRH